jgi:mannose-6-phosphate isomerase-like protein (cupin superfamily)
MHHIWNVGAGCLATLCLGAPLAGQVASTPPAVPATFVTALEVRNAIPASETAPVVDRMVKLVPIGSEYNVGVSVVRRTRQTAASPADALVHEHITEVYQIVEGRGVLVTGGSLVDPRAFPPDSPVVRTLIGPSSRGTAIVNGSAREVGPGDIVVVPPHTPHGFVALHTDEIRYVLVRVDSRRMLQAP